MKTTSALAILVAGAAAVPMRSGRPSPVQGSENLSGESRLAARQLNDDLSGTSGLLSGLLGPLSGVGTPVKKREGHGLLGGHVAGGIGADVHGLKDEDLAGTLGAAAGAGIDTPVGKFLTFFFR